MTDTYDIAILGGGPGGYSAALRAVQRGVSVCIIEAGPLGGACLNVGCIPTKAMLHASGLAFNAGHAAPMGVTVSGVSVDGEVFMARAGEVAAKLRKGLTSLIKARNIDVVTGRGALTAPGVIAVTNDAGGKQNISAKSIIIATGARPVRPTFAPWDSPLVMTTDEAATTTTLPTSVIIVGGGVIGCEFATVYAECGIETHVVEMLPTLAAGVDADAVKIITRSLKKRGVNIHTSVEITNMSAADNSVTATLADGQTISAAAALVAVGRQPNIENIGLETLGVAMVDGVITVDERCRTNVGGLYAVGDVAERRQYAHLAARMGVVAADTATGHNTEDRRTVVPECIYTHPEVASVGLGEADAAELFKGAKSQTFPLAASGLARAFGQIDGFVRLTAHEDTGEVLGGLVVGPRATDVIALIATAMRNRVGIEQLAQTIHAHPTFAEAVGEAAEAWLGLPMSILK